MDRNGRRGMKALPIKTVGVLAGAVIGLLLLHPYVMAVIALIPGDLPKIAPRTLKGFAVELFSPGMLPMTLAFVLFCSGVGLLIAMVVERERSLAAMRRKQERQQAAIAAANRLIMIFSHHLLNSLMAIGVHAKRLQRSREREVKERSLAEIIKRIGELESIMEVMKSMEFQETLEKGEEGYHSIIEASRWIEERLKAKGRPNGEETRRGAGPPP